ncbi:hypothetical protein VNO78_20973 [Psophocarpus tetragonolobus]|uniref:Exostosin GT47 domain-containing protein n=1 Tax=Psophocarpus tetragonolobus TaxID=3891 RepID=A0AAN9XHM0_PSOTE
MTNCRWQNSDSCVLRTTVTLAWASLFSAFPVSFSLRFAQPKEVEFSLVNSCVSCASRGLLHITGFFKCRHSRKMGDILHHVSLSQLCKRGYHNSQMGSSKWRSCAWWSEEASSTMKLTLFMLPFLVVVAFSSIKGSTVYGKDFLASLPPSNSSSQTLLHHLSSNSTLQTLHSNQTKVVNVSLTWFNSTAMNETDEPHRRQQQKRNLSILDRTEAVLAHVRAVIREAKNENQTQDSDYVPTGPMYWNAKEFYRSYIEMEKHFKVFVYEEGDHPVFHNGPCKSIYSMEGNFIHAIEMNDHFRTRDPKKAHVFFLPFSTVMMVRFVYVRDSHDFDPIRRTIRDYINVIAERYPYWNRSLGYDHFMLACHDWGPYVSVAVPYLRKNSIRVLCNANTSEGFDPVKDVSLPEINLQTGSINGFVGGPPASKRPVLAFFAGGIHGPIRPIILEHWENKDEDMQVHKYLPKGVSYYGMLRKSKFCLCPSGYEVASPRLVEAIYTGCVPVLISDHYVPPFSDVLNWKMFSVEVSVKDIPNLKNILMSISPRHYIRMQKRVEQIRRHFEVHSPPKRFDVFHTILHSLWLRRLNFRVHDDQ